MKSSTTIAISGLACLISAANATVCATVAHAASVVPAGLAAPPLSFADLADLADHAPLVATARITDVIALSPEQVTGTPPGFRRLYIEAQVTSLIRGDAGVSPTISYLYDAPLDARGKLPKLKKAQMLIFARPGSRPGQVQLVARDAQIPAFPAEVMRVKALLTEMLARGAPPRITGLGDAFHVAGTVAGESETQIFLRTDTGDPVSLSIIRRPEQAPRWAVALGEIVDEAARPPVPDTLLWYRLACALPATLPPRAVRTLPVPEAEAARADYRFVIESLGPCRRTRAPA